MLLIIILKELRNISESYFCVCHKNRRKNNQYFKTDFFLNKFTLRHIKSNIYIWKTKFVSHKQYLFRSFTSRNTKKTRTDQSIPRLFLCCLKRNDPQTFKSGSCENPFLQCVCYWYNLLRWMFFILYDTFHEKLTLLWDNFKHHVAAFFEASVLKEVRILCVISTITIPKFQNKADYAS